MLNWKKELGRALLQNRVCTDDTRLQFQPLHHHHHHIQHSKLHIQTVEQSPNRRWYRYSINVGPMVLNDILGPSKSASSIRRGTYRS